MTIGSLFSGIGGLELGLERAGLGPVRWQCEIDPFCRAVLARHWPNAERFDDVRTLRGAALVPVEVLCGGFPCQDLSTAGQRAGLDGARSGLWFEYARLVEEVRPKAVVVENVCGLLGRPLDIVAGRLAELGYAVEATRIRAADVGAPHLRERVFLVAVCERRPGVGVQPGWSSRSGGPDTARTPTGREVGLTSSERREVAGREPHGGRLAAPVGPGSIDLAHADGSREPQPGDRRQRRWAVDGREGVGLADPDGLRLEESEHVGAPDECASTARGVRDGNSAAQPGVGRGADGLPAGLDGVGPDGAWPAGRGEAQHPWEPPRTLAGVAARPARLRALGNAVVPQVAYLVGCRVRERLEVAA